MLSTQDVQDELRAAIAEREAYLACSKLLGELNRLLDREGQACSRRARISRNLAAEATQLAARATETAASGSEQELKAVSIAARNVIPRVDRKTQENNDARQRSAESLGDFREKIAISVRQIQSTLTEEQTRSLLNMLVDIAKVEAVVETATTVAADSNAVQEYTSQLEKLNTLDADSSVYDLAFPVGNAGKNRASFDDVDEEVLSIVGELEDLKSAEVVDVNSVEIMQEDVAQSILDNEATRKSESQSGMVFMSSGGSAVENAIQGLTTIVSPEYDEDAFDLDESDATVEDEEVSSLPQGGVINNQDLIG